MPPTSSGVRVTCFGTVPGTQRAPSAHTQHPGTVASHQPQTPHRSSVVPLLPLCRPSSPLTIQTSPRRSNHHPSCCKALFIVHSRDLHAPRVMCSRPSSHLLRLGQPGQGPCVSEPLVLEEAKNSARGETASCWNQVCLPHPLAGRGSQWQPCLQKAAFSAGRFSLTTDLRLSSCRAEGHVPAEQRGCWADVRSTFSPALQPTAPGTGCQGGGGHTSGPSEPLCGVSMVSVSAGAACQRVLFFLSFSFHFSFFLSFLTQGYVY